MSSGRADKILRIIATSLTTNCMGGRFIEAALLLVQKSKKSDMPLDFQK
jgi:hypothetical protein